MIFGANQMAFALWDPQSRGKLDALEVFAGMVVFSCIPY